VVFGYQTSTPVLKGVSVSVVKGEMVGIVGQSGSGKTTLIRLLLRFYDPERGTILVNERPIADIALDRLRASIGIVFQENLILNTSVRNNIIYGIPDVPEKQVIEAARLAGAHDFIRQLPRGYDTVVGEQGRCLSGGQRQRLAVARAVVSDPSLLILDEATSYLELDQESKILRQIKARRKDKLTLLVTHRPSAFRMADRIVTLDNGRIIDAGTNFFYEPAQRQTG
jgi:ABC-type multidrug transport system fused ATPase/permease subunit